MKIIVHGSNGRLGQEIVDLILGEYKGTSLAAAVDRNNTTFPKSLFCKRLDDFKGHADCIIDFSSHSATKDLTDYGVKKRLPIVIATTGQTEEEMELIKEASKKIPIFLAANMSLGVSLLLELAKLTAKVMPGADIEIVETHHNRKLDSPSGTALLIADGIKEVRKDAKYVLGREGKKKREKDEIGIHSIRMGNIVCDHQVIIGTDSETMTLSHRVHTKRLFAEGAIIAAEFLMDKDSGLYGMKDLIG